MKPLEIVSMLVADATKRVPPVDATSAPLPVTADAILDSPAFAMPCRLGEEQMTLRPAFVVPAASDTLSLAVTFDDEPHTLRLAKSSRFLDLCKIWDCRADVPAPILLALVERECSPLFQLLENAVRKQLRLVGLANVANVEMLPIANANVANWELEIGTGNIGNTGNIIRFALTRSSTVVAALGVLRNLDLGHDSVRGVRLDAETEYAAFQLTDADLASLAPGDAVMLPEIGAVLPRLIAAGVFVLDESGVAPYKEDAMCRVRGATKRTVSLGELFDAAEGARAGATEHEADAINRVPPANTPLHLVRGGQTLATGCLDRLADQHAFIVESTPNS